MAELADAPDLGSGVFDVGVQVPSGAPNKKGPFGSFLFVKSRGLEPVRAFCVMKTVGATVFSKKVEETCFLSDADFVCDAHFVRDKFVNNRGKQ